MFVRLKTKLAEVVDGVDLSYCAEGDVIELPEQQAAMLIAEGWAKRAAPDEVSYVNRAERAIADDASRKANRRRS